jgi:hypothetical protein
VSASGTDAAGISAQDRVDEAASIVRQRLGDHIWAEGETTWSDAVGERLTALGWRLTVEEMGTGGQVAALFGEVPWLELVRVRPAPDRVDPADRAPADDAAEDTDEGEGRLLPRATAARDEAGVEVGLAVRVRPRGSEYAVSVAIVTPTGERRQTRATYIGGAMGRSQAALIAAATLFETLGERP